MTERKLITLVLLALLLTVGALVALSYKDFWKTKVVNPIEKINKIGK